MSDVGGGRGFVLFALPSAGALLSRKSNLCASSHGIVEGGSWFVIGGRVATREAGVLVEAMRVAIVPFSEERRGRCCCSWLIDYLCCLGGEGPLQGLFHSIFVCFGEERHASCHCFVCVRES